MLQVPSALFHCLLRWASGKDADYVPEQVAAPSPGLTDEQQAFLAKRGVKHECHSDNVADEAEAKQAQAEYVTLNVDGD